MTNPFPIECLSCGATGEVFRVTANLQCRCGSTDLDLYDGEHKTAAEKWNMEQYWDDEGNLHLPDHLDHPYGQGYDQGRAGHDNRHDLHGLPGGHPEARDLGHEHGERDYQHVKDNKSLHFANSGGTGWNKSQPDPDANWDEYAGPTPGPNPYAKQKMDADANNVCPVCNGTGSDARASGGGYEENVCRNCHGTGKVTYASDSHGTTNDATTSKVPPLGASSAKTQPKSKSRTQRGFPATVLEDDTDSDRDSHLSKGDKVQVLTHSNPDDDQDGTSWAIVKHPAGHMHWIHPDKLNMAKQSRLVAIPAASGAKVVSASKSDKLMTMAAKIVETNSGLSTQQAFELARRAVEAFPEGN